jgi:hypothetical protein
LVCEDPQNLHLDERIDFVYSLRRHGIKLSAWFEKLQPNLTPGNDQSLLSLHLSRVTPIIYLTTLLGDPVKHKKDSNQTLITNPDFETA